MKKKFTKTNENVEDLSAASFLNRSITSQSSSSNSGEEIYIIDNNTIDGLEETGEPAVKRQQTKSNVESIETNLKEKMEKISVMAFESDNKQDREVTNKAWGLENWMFGDVAVIIELYNSIVPCYKIATPKRLMSRRVHRFSKRRKLPSERSMNAS
jgi:hypothetical protein